MNNSTSDGTRTSRIVIVVISLILIIGLTAFAMVLALGDTTGEMLSREEILANIEEYGEEDRGHNYVASYLTDLGVGSFQADRFRNAEVYFENLYVGEMPKKNVHAVATAELFLDNFYDEIDLTDRKAVTTALIKCYVAASGDPYAVYRSPEEFTEFDDDMSGEFVGIGVLVQDKFVEGTYDIESVYVLNVFPGSGADAAGIKKGDYITAVDGVPVTEFNGDNIATAMRGEEGTTVDITVLRGETELTLTCTRSKVEEITASHTIEDGIGYITITSFKANTAEQFGASLSAVKLAGVKGIVFDLRNNPGGYLDSVIEIISMLVPEGTRVVSYTDSLSGEVIYKAEGGTKLNVPIVVLCNEYSASAAELFTSAMRDYDDMGILDVTIVGKNTYGKGVMQSSFPLPDGGYLTLTMAYYNPPSDVNYDGVGIAPDVEVEPSELGDAQLDMATTVIKKMIADSGKLVA